MSGFSRTGGRPPFEKFYIYVLMAFVGYAIADLSVLSFRPEMLPSEAPPTSRRRASGPKPAPRSAYSIVTDRNIFNSDGKIPEALSSDKDQAPDPDGPAVASKLPLKLLGTIVHFKPEMSIATVNLSNRNKTAAYKVGEEIDGIARVISIDRRKMIFMNLNLRRREYIDIPEDLKLNFGFSKPKPANTGGEIQKRGEFDFAIKRSDLDKYTSDLSSILRQARMVPNQGPDGEVNGFRFVSIKSDSVFSKLGFQVGDSIVRVNDDKVNSPTKAMEMYNSLKAGNGVNLGVIRDGREETFNYSIE